MGFGLRGVAGFAGKSLGGCRTDVVGVGRAGDSVATVGTVEALGVRGTGDEVGVICIGLTGIGEFAAAESFFAVLLGFGGAADVAASSELVCLTGGCVADAGAGVDDVIAVDLDILVCVEAVSGVDLRAVGLGFAGTVVSFGFVGCDISAGVCLPLAGDGLGGGFASDVCGDLVASASAWS